MSFSKLDINILDGEKIFIKLTKRVMLLRVCDVTDRVTNFLLLLLLLFQFSNFLKFVTGKKFG